MKLRIDGYRDYIVENRGKGQGKYGMKKAEKVVQTLKNGQGQMLLGTQQKT